MAQPEQENKYIVKVVSNNIFQFDCTGNKIYAHSEIIGLVKMNNGEFDITQGYDGGITFEDEGKYFDDLAPEEKKELADYMIALWQEYKNSIK